MSFSDAGETGWMFIYKGLVSPFQNQFNQYVQHELRHKVRSSSSSDDTSSMESEDVAPLQFVHNTTAKLSHLNTDKGY